MSRLGCDAFNDLNGPKIHRLENILTLEASTHKYFDDLDLYLERTVSKHPKRIHSMSNAATANSPPIQTGFLL
jgi:hypothetical protein